MDLTLSILTKTNKYIALVYGHIANLKNIYGEQK